MENKTEIKVLGTMREIFETPNEILTKYGNFTNCVYCWMVNGRVCYVGQTRDFIGRHRQNGGHYGIYRFANECQGESTNGVTKKYLELVRHGIDNVYVGILTSDRDLSELEDLERFYIAKYHTYSKEPNEPYAWNLTPGGIGGNGGVKGHKWTEEQCKAHSEVMSKVYSDPAQLAKIRELRGSKEYRDRASETTKNSWANNQEFREKMKQIMSTPEYRKLHSDHQTAYWSDPMKAQLRAKKSILSKCFKSMEFYMRNYPNLRTVSELRNCVTGPRMYSIDTIIGHVSEMRMDARWNSDMELILGC